MHIVYITFRWYITPCFKYTCQNYIIYIYYTHEALKEMIIFEDAVRGFFLRNAHLCFPHTKISKNFFFIPLTVWWRYFVSLISVADSIIVVTRFAGFLSRVKLVMIIKGEHATRKYSVFLPASATASFYCRYVIFLVCCIMQRTGKILRWKMDNSH